MKYNFIIDPEQAWEAMRQAILSARKFIYWELYIFVDDVSTLKFCDLLREKAKSGVSVKIILDSLGSFNFSSETARALRVDGVELLYFNDYLTWWNPWRVWRWLFLRTHRKLLVVDGEVGFIGSLNVGAQFGRWHELQLRMSGNILRHFIKSFAKSYKYSGGMGQIIVPPKMPGRLRVSFLERWPWSRESNLKRFYIEKCSRAKKSIVIVTPYFAPPHWLLRVLREAVGRGVGVEVIMPKETDVWISNVANKVFAAIGYQYGIKFFLLPKMIHAKALLVDGKEGVVGSQNINSYSFDYNVESSVVFHDEDMVGDLRVIIDRWRSEAEVFTYPKNKRRWYHPILERIFKLLRPIL